MHTCHAILKFSVVPFQKLICSKEAVFQLLQLVDIVKLVLKFLKLGRHICSRLSIKDAKTFEICGSVTRILLTPLLLALICGSYCNTNQVRITLSLDTFWRIRDMFTVFVKILLRNLFFLQKVVLYTINV